MLNPFNYSFPLEVWNGIGFTESISEVTEFSTVPDLIYNNGGPIFYFNDFPASFGPEYFAIRLQYDFYLEEDREMFFSTWADDGLRLYFDDVLVVVLFHYFPFIYRRSSTMTESTVLRRNYF